jgi:hypothetical protein
VAFLDEMVDRGIRPKKQHYVAVVEACERAGELRLAQDIERRWAQDKERLARSQHPPRIGGRGGGGPAQGREGIGPKYPFQPRR